MLQAINGVCQHLNQGCHSYATEKSNLSFVKYLLFSAFHSGKSCIFLAVMGKSIYFPAGHLEIQTVSDVGKNNLKFISRGCRKF